MSKTDKRLHVARVPSNIAFVKYWGKRDTTLQWPANDSLSMTLSAAHTITSAQIATGGPDRIEAGGTLLSGKRLDKARKHLDFLRAELGFAAPLLINTKNSFPSDCGIASSASGLAALTVAAIAAWTDAGTLADLDAEGFDRRRLAALARRGSGSACRSLFGGYVAWQAGGSPAEQSVRVVRDAESMPLVDLIVIVSTAAKTHGSTEAHQTAWSSPLFAPRLAGLPERFARVESAIKRGDFSALGHEIETEALEMHAVMMSSTPSANYFAPQTSEITAWLRRERLRGEFEAYFTIDAGPNLHVICEPKAADYVASRIQAAFPTQSGAPLEVLRDHTGSGPVLNALNLDEPR